jgi:hypothetical protein
MIEDASWPAPQHDAATLPDALIQTEYVADLANKSLNLLVFLGSNFFLSAATWGKGCRKRELGKTSDPCIGPELTNSIKVFFKLKSPTPNPDPPPIEFPFPVPQRATSRAFIQYAMHSPSGGNFLSSNFLRSGSDASSQEKRRSRPHLAMKTTRLCPQNGDPLVCSVCRPRLNAYELTPRRDPSVTGSCFG